MSAVLFLVLEHIAFSHRGTTLEFCQIKYSKSKEKVFAPCRERVHLLNNDLPSLVGVGNANMDVSYT